MIVIFNYSLRVSLFFCFGTDAKGCLCLGFVCFFLLQFLQELIAHGTLTINSGGSLIAVLIGLEETP